MTKDREKFFKLFYAPEQNEEAYAFQKETGWHMIWGSDYQGLNGSTYVVYRDVSDLPVWLQDYAREVDGKQEHLRNREVSLDAVLDTAWERSGETVKDIYSKDDLDKE